jgi:hypothetical protein
MKLTLILAVTVIVMLIAMSAPKSVAQATGDALLNQGDSIPVYIDKDSFEALKKAMPGQTVTMKVLDNVMRFDQKLVNKQETVYATMIERRGGSSFGRNGKMTINFDSTHSSGGTLIPLRGVVQLKGQGGGIKRIISILPPWLQGFVLKGNDVSYPEGKNFFKPVVKEDTPVVYQK